MIVQANVLFAFISNGISDYTPIQGIGYMIITEALLMLTGLDGGLGDLDIDSMIKNGSIIQYWIKPLDFISYIIGLEAGRIFYYLLWRSIPVFVIGCLIYLWLPSVHFMMYLAFFLSVIDV